MPEIISCNCVPPVKKYEYGSSQPVDPGDTRTEITYREYYQDQTISEMELPVCIKIGEEAFRESSIKEIIVPECITIEDGAFRSSTLAAGDFSSVTTIGDYSFYNCDSVYADTVLEFPSIKEIGAHAFDSAGVNNGAYINFFNVETLGEKAFYNSYYLKNIGDTLNLPNCKTINKQALAGYASVDGFYASYIYLPSIVSIGEQAFRGIVPSNRHFEMHIGPNCTSIGDNILFFGTVYDALVRDFYIEAINPPALASPFETSVGSPYWYPTHVYVPSQSVNTYKEHPNWAWCADYITAMPT